MKSLLKVGTWYIVTVLVFFLSVQLYQKMRLTKYSSGLLRQEIIYVSRQKSPSFAFAAIPKAAQEIKTALQTRDARPVIIDKYLKYYQSPMYGMGEFIVGIADKYQVDPYLIVAIAQQESNLGKKVPPECYNAWGWGIHSAGTLCFDSWKEGIEEYTKGLSENYIAYGLTTPDTIMDKYVPHSPERAWAKGVTQFLASLQSGDW